MDIPAKSDSSEQPPATRRIRTLAEKLSILREIDQPGASVAAVARRHGMNANLLFAWRRLHTKGLLESQRHAPPLLPVKVTSPTITPTRRGTATAKPSRVHPVSSNAVATAGVEIVLVDGVRVRLSGDAQRRVLDRILDWLPPR